MKALRYLLMLAWLVPATAWAQERSICVLVYGEVSAEREFIQNELITAFTDDGTYTAYERQTEFIELINREHAFQQSGFVSDATILDIASKVGTRYVCGFKMLNPVFGEQPIAARILDVESGRVVNSVQWSGVWGSMASVRQTCKEICRKMTRSRDL